MKIDLTKIARWSVFARPTGKDSGGGERFDYLRVVGLDRDTTTGDVAFIATYELNGSNPSPQVHTAGEFTLMLQMRNLIACDFNPARTRVRCLEDIKTEHVEARKLGMNARLKLAQFVDRKGFSIFDPSFRSKTYAEVCAGAADDKTHGESWVRELMSKWWHYGGNPMAFVEDYFGCGAKSRESILAEAEKNKTEPVFLRRFRKHAETRLRTKEEGCEIEPDMYDEIVSTMKKVLDDEDKRYGLAKAVKRMKGMPWALFRKEIHKALKKKFGTLVLAEGTSPKTDLEHYQLPNRDQIRYIGRKIMSVPEALRKIKGSRAFQLENRAITGDSRDIANWRGQVYEIDAFELDLHSVNDVTLLPLGRLFVYFVVDVYTRAIVGVYVTCGDPDYRQAVMALRCAFMRKSEWGKIIDLEISDLEWPMCGMADSLLADGGELATHASDVLPELGSVDIANTPPCRGDLKAQVEQTGELADAGLIRFLPGATKGPRERCSDAPEKRAKLSFKKITHLLTEWAYKVHNKRDLSGSFIDPELIGRKVKMTPNGLWADSVRKRGILPAYDDNVYLARMLPRHIAKITRQGIVLGDIIFDRPKDPVFRLMKEGATTFGCDRFLAVHYDWMLTKQVYIVPEDPTNPVLVVPRSVLSREWDGYCFKEARDAIAVQELAGQVNKNEHHRCDINHSLKVDAAILAQTAEILERYGSLAKRNRVAVGIGKDAPRADQEEQQLAREAAAMPVPPEPTTPTITVPVSPTEDPPLPAGTPPVTSLAKPSVRPKYF